MCMNDNAAVLAVRRPDRSELVGIFVKTENKPQHMVCVVRTASFKCGKTADKDKLEEAKVMMIELAKEYQTQKVSEKDIYPRRDELLFQRTGVEKAKKPCFSQVKKNFEGCQKGQGPRGGCGDADAKGGYEGCQSCQDRQGG